MNTIRSSRQPIIAGFSLILVLLLGMGGLGISYMSDMQNRLENIVNIHNLRTEYVNNMRNIARERSLLLYQMNLERDFFFTDETIVKMSTLAGEFIRIREMLQSITPPDSLEISFEDIMPDITHSTSIQRDVITLLEEERYDDADTLLTKESIPTQDAVLKRYDKFAYNEQKMAHKAVDSAAQHYNTSLHSMTILGTLLLGLGLFISVYVLRKVSSAENDLRELNIDLENRVTKRTENLSQSNEELAITLDELKNTQSQLVQAEKMASLGSLVAGISHEINTPIGIAMTAITHQHEKSVELEKEYHAGNMMRSQLEKYVGNTIKTNELIINNLRRASELIASFKRVAIDQSNEYWETIDIHEYINSIILSLQPKFKHSHIIINNDAKINLNIFIIPGAIYQIISNLMLNSLFHAFEDNDEGNITIECKQIENEIILTYTDDGKGMNEEQKHKAFDPFFTTKRGQGGSGLGLHLVYNLVTSSLEGSISLHSEPHKGSKFEIIIPTQEASKDHKAE